MSLTAIRMVTCLTRGWLFIQAERGQPAAFLKMIADQKRLYPGIVSSARLGKRVWPSLINEDDWVRILGLCGFPFWVCSLGFSFGPID